MEAVYFLGADIFLMLSIVEPFYSSSKNEGSGNRIYGKLALLFISSRKDMHLSPPG